MTAPDVDPAVPLLSVADLTISASTSAGARVLVEDLSLDLFRGEVVGVVGESGSGKSMTARAILGLLPPSVSVTGGTIDYKGVGNLLAFDDASVAALRGSMISAVFQDPSSGLNPVVTIGRQLQWAAQANNGGLRAGAAKQRALEYLELVGLDAPRRVYRSFPHELSGGMRQRVLIAMALIGEPELLLADEPTTALDVTTQERVLDLLVKLKSDLGLTMVFISHDLPVVSKMCDRVAVMYAGRVVETGQTADVIRRPVHPYTTGLLAASLTIEEAHREVKPIPGTSIAAYDVMGGCSFADRCEYSRDLELCRNAAPPPVASESGYALCHFPVDGTPRVARTQARLVSPDKGRGLLFEAAQPSTEERPVLEVINASKTFVQRGGRETRAVSEVSLSLARGVAAGLVGESGSGKTTVSRMILRLTRPSVGRVRYQGDDVWEMDKRQLKGFRADVQLVQQNPYSALNPRLSIRGALTEPLRIRGVGAREAEQRAEETLRSVGMDAAALNRRPGAFSGGQRQRLVIARALVTQPKVLVLDEPVSALDVSVQAQVLELLRELQSKYSLTYLFVSHDLGVVNYLCDEVFVMQKGRIVEAGERWQVLHDPQHPYTRDLIASVPTFERELDRSAG